MTCRQRCILRAIVAEGMVKLMLHERLLSNKILARLLTLWLDPSTEEEARLRAVLGHFFPAFAASDRFAHCPPSFCVCVSV